MLALWMYFWNEQTWLDNPAPTPVVSETAPAVSVLSESVPSDGGFLVGVDLATVRGKFIYRNAPPDQSAFIKVRGQGLRAELGDAKAFGEASIAIEGVGALMDLGRVQISAGATVFSRGLEAKSQCGAGTALGVVDITDEELLLIIGELVS